MKQVTIVGLGMSADTLTAEGLRAIEQAQVLAGAPRLVALFAHLDRPSFPEYAPQGVASLVGESPAQRFCVLVSGDPGFYSAAEGLCAALAPHDVRVVPGVSSLSCFFARLKRPWQEAATVSCHGRRANLVDAVRRNALTFALTGGNVPQLGAALTQAGFGGLTVHIGQDLGMPGERIFSLTAAELPTARLGNLAVLLVENPCPDSRVRFGIPDEAFLRGRVPMTKSEVRAVTLSRLDLSPGGVCCDIGAGTGSVTVEMALAAHQGQVYAVDQNPAAIELIRANCRAFHLGNVTAVLGGAPEALAELPPFDAAFIGGSTGRLPGIFEALFAKNPRVRVVVNAVTLETLQAAAQAFSARGIALEITQVSAARAKPLGNTHMLEACSPVFVLSGGGNG